MSAGGIKSASQNAKADDGRVRRVLIVDDDAPLARMLSLTLRDGGFEVMSAANGQMALEQVTAAQPDAIVLDLEMPVMDGRAFFRELRARGDATPVLVLSAYGARRAQRELGADGHLDKPFDPEALVGAVREIL
jgi:CheY-like chemotaxis protein